MSGIMITTKREKKFYSKIFGMRPLRPLQSLLYEERQRVQYESEPDVIRYGFLPEKMSQFSDEDLQIIIEEMMWMDIRSPYDCTGKPFTKWIDWHRNPNGRISYQHYIGVDC